MFDEFDQESRGWLADLLEKTTDHWEEKSPSDWAESTRYLPRTTSPKPGVYSFADTPYWREVVDCFSPESGVRMVAVLKSAQIGATVSVLENIIGFYIDEIKTMPVLFFTADAELAQTRMDTAIMPMIQASNMSHLIMANDDLRAGKRGATNKKLEWAGGGYLLPLGAINAAKMRSLSAPILLRDEISGWPLIVGRDGDPLVLTETRTNSYEQTRKILDLSTPAVAETCAITKRYKMGDQRKFMVPCVHCGEFQELKFRGVNDDGMAFGLRWVMENGHVKQGSTRYICRHCGEEMRNEQKSIFMGKGYWMPTATSSSPEFRSYHISALYSPAFARTWDAIAAAWVECWDDDNNVAKDIEKLQVFYNNDLGMAFEVKSDRIKEYQVTPHKRSEYVLGQVPNRHAETHTGGPIELLVMTVDVQAHWLACAVWGFSPSADNAGYNCYLVDSFRPDGETDNAEGPIWGQIAEMIDNKVYYADGRAYPISLTLIDSSYRQDAVYAFCSQWETGVYPLRGRDKAMKAGAVKEFNILENSTGVRYVAITVDLYKDRWSAALKRQWDGIDKMPRNNLSMPGDLPDKIVRELTVEYVAEKRDPSNGKLLGTYWKRPNSVRNEIWDLLCYGTAGLEMLAHDICSNEIGVEALIWSDFWAVIREDGRYWRKVD